MHTQAAMVKGHRDGRKQKKYTRGSRRRAQSPLVGAHAEHSFKATRVPSDWEKRGAGERFGGEQGHLIHGLGR